MLHNPPASALLHSDVQTRLFGQIFGARLLGATLDGTRIGGVTPEVGTFTTLVAGAIDNTPIGQNIAEQAAFTDLFVLQSEYITERAAAQADIAARGQFWVKDDTPNNAVFTDDTGINHLLTASTFKSYTFASRAGAHGTVYLAGYYDWSATDVTLTIGGTTTQTYGSTNLSYAAHAGVVASGAGGTNLVLTVSGTSITDAGVRTAGDSQVIVADADTAITDEYFETSKKWLGTITFTLTGAAGAFTFNYGLSKYEDFGNHNFIVTDFEAVGLAKANDTGFNVLLCPHKATGWTYAAAAFTPGGSAIVSMNTDHNTEINLAAGEHFAYKHAGLSEALSGGASEGVLVRVVTGANNSISYMDVHIGVHITV